MKITIIFRNNCLLFSCYFTTCNAIRMEPSKFKVIAGTSGNFTHPDRAIYFKLLTVLNSRNQKGRRITVKK